MSKRQFIEALLDNTPKNSYSKLSFGLCIIINTPTPKYV